MQISARLVAAFIVGATLVAPAFDSLRLQTERERRTGEVERQAVVLSDAGDVVNQPLAVWRLDAMQFLIEALVIAGVVVFIVRWSIAGPVERTTEWMRRLRTGDFSESVRLPTSKVFAPLVTEVLQLTKSLTAARAAAEEEARCAMPPSRCGRPSA